LVEAAAGEVRTLVSTQIAAFRHRMRNDG